MAIRTRLALFGLLVVAITLTAFTLAFYALLAAGGSNSQDEQLSERAGQALQALASARPEDLEPGTVPAPVDPEVSTDLFVALLGSDGRGISSTGAVDGRIPSVPAEVLATATAEGEASSTIEAAPGVRLRVHVRPWNRDDLGLSGYVVVAQSTRRVDEELRIGRIFLIFAAIFAFIVAAMAIWLVIGRALRPLKQLAGLTDEVGATQDLSRRLPVPQARDEVRRLSESFNGMMARLEEAHNQLAGTVEAQKRFVADASHELRTPLTTIRSNIGFLLQHPEAKEEDRRAALGDIASESERMSRLVQDLLTLARADGGFHLEKGPVDLSNLVREIARQATRLHPQLQVRVDVEDVTLPANEDALKQLLWILIDNAVRHMPPDGRLRFALDTTADAVHLRVVDDGNGIPEADLPRVFDRFYQADAARSHGGSGLGLSIARWIVEEHGGTISAHNNDLGGATISVRLPLAEPGAAPEPELEPSPPEAEASPDEIPASDSPLPKPTP